MASWPDNAMVEVVVVEEGLAAGVAGERVERVLRLLEVAGVGKCGSAGVDAGVARRALRGVAERRCGNEAARVDGPE
jgi:hypothetical protein